MGAGRDVVGKMCRFCVPFGVHRRRLWSASVAESVAADVVDYRQGYINQVKWISLFNVSRHKWQTRSFNLTCE
jgi:hypothetical protein